MTPQNEWSWRKFTVSRAESSREGAGSAPRMQELYLNVVFFHKQHSSILLQMIFFLFSLCWQRSGYQYCLQGVVCFENHSRFRTLFPFPLLLLPLFFKSMYFFPHNHWHFTALVIPKAMVWGSNICCCSSMPHRTYTLLHTNEMSLADHLNSFLLLHKSQQ